MSSDFKKFTEDSKLHLKVTTLEFPFRAGHFNVNEILKWKRGPKLAGIVFYHEIPAPGDDLPQFTFFALFSPSEDSSDL